MNTDLFLTINSWTGKNALIDNAMIFSAQSLIYILFLAAAVCLGYLAYKRHWREVMLFFIALGTSFVILLILSKLYVSSRPFVDHTITQLLPHSANQSFPSDHATASFAIALAILVFTRFKKIGWTLLVVAALVGFARIYTGVHYPLDVAGALVTACAGIGITLIIAKFLPVKQSVQFDTKSDEN
jgi:undecaprenyl-diphosphatase